MKKTTSLFFVLLFSVAGFAQQGADWGRWTWLIGEWRGEGNGKPGQGSGGFSFAPDLGSKVLVRKSHSEYPAAGDKPAVVHDDLMIVYPGNGNSKAIYFDNEGHVINYTVSVSDRTIIMTSDKMPGTPVFRLTYTLLPDAGIETKFEMSQDGNTFMMYVSGKSNRVK